MARGERCAAPVRLDAAEARAWRGDDLLALGPRAFALLQHLADRPGRLVTKAELFAAVWEGVAVTDAALTVCVSEIRRALGDDARMPRYVETVSRRGYRFIGPVAGIPARPAESPGVAPASARPPMVGRAPHLQRLLSRLERARAGQRGTVFVTGEPGIGKTALLEAFLDRAAQAPGWIARGQCLQHHGAGETYLPILDALSHLGRGPGASRVVDLLARYAPTWLGQLPGLSPRGARGEEPPGTPERMLRELGELVEALAADRPLVLALEDLHWSDHGTIDAIAWLSRRRESARVLIVGTYRPVDLIVGGHPLRGVAQELALRRHAESLPLELLDERAVADYLVARFGDRWAAPGMVRDLAGALHRRTDGHPLFLLTVADHAIQRGWLLRTLGGPTEAVSTDAIASTLPDTLRELIQQDVERLGAEEQRLLEAASVAGETFSAAAVAAAMALDVDAVETRCQRLASRDQFLKACGEAEWPDGTVAGVYGFRHSLHRDAVYERLPAGRRTRLHRRIAEREEVAWGSRTAERAAELAHRFGEAGDRRRAIDYRRLAAENALARRGYHEAVGHLTCALGMVERLSATAERTRLELDLQATLGPALMAIRGIAAPEVEQTFRRALALCRQVPGAPHLFQVVHGAWAWHLVRGDAEGARVLAEQLGALAETDPSPPRLSRAHLARGLSLYMAGQLVPAVESFEQVLRMDDSGSPDPSFPVGIDPFLASRRYGAIALHAIGHAERALEWIGTALGQAMDRGEPPELTAALLFAARLYQHRGEPAPALDRAEAAIELAREYGFRQRLAAGTILRGWSRAARGDAAGLAEMREGLAAYRGTGAEDDVPYWLSLLADGYRAAGEVEAGLAAVDEALALVRSRGLTVWAPDLLRLRGEILLLGPASQPAAAHASFGQAAEVARQQGARAVEQRIDAVAIARARSATQSASSLSGAGGRRAGERGTLAP